MSLKHTLGKFAFRRAIGVYVSEREVAVSQLASTPFGPVEMSRSTEKYEADQLERTLQRMLRPVMGSRKKFPIPVAVGLSGTRVFFTTRLIKSSNAEASPQMLLHEVLQSSSVSIDDMVLDVVKAQPYKRPLASIASCRKKYLSGLLTALGGAGVNPQRAEPAPCALLRTAVFQYRAPRRAKTVIRIFLGTDQGLVVLAASNLPFAWRYFTLVKTHEANSILSAVRTLQTLSKPCGIEAAVEVVMIHGRPDLRPTVELDHLKEEIGVHVVWHATPGLDESNFAFGLALGCLNQSSDAFDLARSLKPQRSLWEIFPWSEMAAQAALIGGMGLFLADRSVNTEHAFRSLKLQIAEHQWMESSSEADLEKEKKELGQQVEAVRKFLASRIVWTSYVHDIPARLPKNATMNVFEGMSELESMGKKKDSGTKQKKSFMLRLSAPIPQSGAMPKDIDDFLNSLREHPLLKKDFPIVELMDLKWYQPYQGAESTALFTVMCMPKKQSAKDAPPAEEEKH